MNRTAGYYYTSYDRMPHVGGDEPQIAEVVYDPLKYAPRMWG